MSGAPLTAEELQEFIDIVAATLNKIRTYRNPKARQKAYDQVAGLMYLAPYCPDIVRHEMHNSRMAMHNSRMASQIRIMKEGIGDDIRQIIDKGRS